MKIYDKINIPNEMYIDNIEEEYFYLLKIVTHDINA